MTPAQIVALAIAYTTVGVLWGVLSLRSFFRRLDASRNPEYARRDPTTMGWEDAPILVLWAMAWPWLGPITAVLEQFTESPIGRKQPKPRKP